MQVGRALGVGWKLLVKPGRLGEHLALHHLAPGSLRADECNLDLPLGQDLQQGHHFLPHLAQSQELLHQLVVQWDRLAFRGLLPLKHLPQDYDFHFPTWI